LTRCSIASMPCSKATGPERVRLRIPQKEGKMLAQLQAGARIYSRQYQDGLVVLEAEAPGARCCGGCGSGWWSEDPSLYIHAADIGGNAVVGARYDATEVMQGVTEVLAYGTAVVVEAAPKA
jgi:hypothetical protein